MGLSLRGLTQGVMGGLTAYRRGAMQGTEDQRAIAAAEQARQRQMEQDKQLALYRQMENELANRRIAVDQEQAKMTLANRPYQPKTREDMLADLEAKARVNARYRPRPASDKPDRPTVPQMQSRLADLRNARDPDTNAPLPMKSVADVWADMRAEFGDEVNRLPIARTMRGNGGGGGTAAVLPNNPADLWEYYRRQGKTPAEATRLTRQRFPNAGR